MTLIEFLADYCGAVLTERRGEDAEELATLVAGLVTLPDGRRLILLERTYRQGIHLIPDPTEEEIAVMRSGDLWDLWNSDRSTGLGGIF